MKRCVLTKGARSKEGKKKEKNKEWGKGGEGKYFGCEERKKKVGKR